MKLGRVMGFIFISRHVGEEGSSDDVLLAEQRKLISNSAFEKTETSVDMLIHHGSKLLKKTTSPHYRLFRD